jgi:hypothetical protein
VRCARSNHDPLDPIEADLIAPAIVELRRARRPMVCDRRGLFQRAAVLLVGGDTGRPEAAVAELGGNASGSGAPGIIAQAFARGSTVRVRRIITYKFNRSSSA